MKGIVLHVSDSLLNLALVPGVRDLVPLYLRRKEPCG